MEMWKTAIPPMGNTIHGLMEKPGLSHSPQTPFPIAPSSRPFTHNPTAPTIATITVPVLSDPD